MQKPHFAVAHQARRCIDEFGISQSFPAHGPDMPSQRPPVQAGCAAGRVTGPGFRKVAATDFDDPKAGGRVIMTRTPIARQANDCFPKK